MVGGREVRGGGGGCNGDDASLQIGCGVAGKHSSTATLCCLSVYTEVTFSRSRRGGSGGPGGGGFARVFGKYNGKVRCDESDNSF